MSGKHDDDDLGRSRRRWLFGVAGLGAVALLVVWWPGCRQYPAVTRKESLKLMKLLYAACNTKDEKRLTEVEKGIERLTREGKMTQAEKEGFDKIIAMAKDGKWEKAEDAAFKFAQDQVGQGHSDPDTVKHDPDKKAKPPKGRGK